MVPQAQASERLEIYDPIIEAQSQVDDQGYHEKVGGNIDELLSRNNWRQHIARARQQLDAQTFGNRLVPLAEIIIQARSSQVVESLSRINELSLSGHFRSAMEEAFYALQYAPTYLPIHAYMGEILLQQDQPQEAIEKFITVAKTFSTRGEARRAIEYFPARHRYRTLRPGAPASDQMLRDYRFIPPRKSLVDSQEFEQSVGREAAQAARARLQDAILVSGDVFLQLRDVGEYFGEAITKIESGEWTAQEAMEWVQEQVEK